MKELQDRKRDRLAVQVQQEQEHELELDSRIVPHRNHTLYEIDLSTMKVRRAVFDKESTYKLRWGWKKGDPIVGCLQLVRKHGCAYVSALNASNALKQLQKGANGTKFNSNNYLRL
jgi:hypothetical protein